MVRRSGWFRPVWMLFFLKICLLLVVWRELARTSGSFIPEVISTNGRNLIATLSDSIYNWDFSGQRITPNRLRNDWQRELKVCESTMSFRPTGEISWCLPKEFSILNFMRPDWQSRHSIPPCHFDQREKSHSDCQRNFQHYILGDQNCKGR